MRKSIYLLLFISIVTSCTNNDSEQLLKRPLITQISPSLITAGSEIIITGTDLNNSPLLFFDGQILEATNIENSKIVLNIPEGTSSGKLEIKFAQPEYNAEYFLKIVDSNWNETDASNYFQLKFISRTVGFAKRRKTNTHVIDKTTDGGKTWFTILEVPVPNSLFEAVSANVFYIRTISNVIKKTVDGGVTWQDIGALEIGNLIEEIFFKNELEGFLLARKSGKSYIFKTMDGGNTWSENKVLDISTTYIKLVQHKNDTIKLFNAQANSIISTLDGGDTWVEESLGVEITYKPIFHFVSENNIWLNMLPRIENHGGLFNKNSSNNWEKIEIPESPSYEKIINIAFSDELKGHLLTEEGGSLYTTNGGETWELFYLDEPGEITAVTSFDNTLYVVKGGKLLKKEIN